MNKRLKTVKFYFLIPSVLPIFCILQCFLRDERGVAAFCLECQGVGSRCEFQFLNVSHLKVLEIINESLHFGKEA